MSSKKWNRIVLLTTLVILGICAALTAYIDPFFHYHKPIDYFQYVLNDERYQNRGIAQHFEYDAVITGTSMCENFKTSELDALWGTNAIKIPFAGGTNKEIDLNLRAALESANDVKIVIRSLDYTSFANDKDDMNRSIFNQPDYLYDLNVFNDAPYLLNKQVLLEHVYDVIGYTRNGGVTTSFDSYANWSDAYDYGEESIFEWYERVERVDVVNVLEEDERQKMLENIHQNVIQTAVDYPEVTFYIFFPPYSILYWDELDRRGELGKHMEMERCVIEELLPYDNIRLYSFSTNYNMTCDLDNYKDQAHYGQWINSSILDYIHRDEFRITGENYEEYLSSVGDFYGNYDYSIFD